MLITLDEAVTHLAKGDIVALPSETVYGLAGLALDNKSVQKIYALKGRPSNNPLIIHVSNLVEGEKLATFNELARKAAALFWPGPLTLVLPKKSIVPDLVTAGNPTVALRIPGHKDFLEILSRLGQPLAAPSANPSNRTSPTEAKHIKELFAEKCPPTVDGGKCTVGLESTVLDLSGKHPVVMRPGLITRVQLEKSLSSKVQSLKSSTLECRNAKNKKLVLSSPGMNPVHYAPITPLSLYSSVEEFLDSDCCIEEDKIIVSNEEDCKVLYSKGYSLTSLSTDGCPQKIARNLYATLIEFDKEESKRIHLIFSGVTSGINCAIMDRLNRAKSK